MTNIKWTRTAGRLTKIAATVGPAIYAKSDDGRFIIWVYRCMLGTQGRRQYHYTFSATDYRSTAGARFTNVPVKDTEQSDPKKVMAAVTRWAVTCEVRESFEKPAK